MSDLIIKNANICNAEDNIFLSDILIKNGKILKISENISENQASKVINANKEIVMPGFIDIHTHVGEQTGLYEPADDFLKLSSIAILNGITSFFSFVTENESLNLLDKIKIIEEKARHSLCDYGFHLTPIKFDSESLSKIENLINKGYKSFKLYTTYRQAGLYSSYIQIEEFANFLKRYHTTLLVHCEDDEILNLHKDKFLNDARTFYLSRPPQAETEAIKKIIKICKNTKQKIHIVHVSTAESVKILNHVKKDIPITFETCPQYMFINDELIKNDNANRFLCSPPLRSEENRQEMLKNINDIDCFATDHCPYTIEQKDTFPYPCGIPGTGALIPLFYNIFKDTPNLLVKHLSEMPAKISGIYPHKGIIKEGSDADLVVLASGKNKKIKSSFSDCYDPYSNMTSSLKILYVIKNGEITVQDNQIKSIPKTKNLNTSYNI